jgi:hypothetical protein
MFSASKLASFKIDAASFFRVLYKIVFFSMILAIPKPATIPIIPEITIVYVHVC